MALPSEGSSRSEWRRLVAQSRRMKRNLNNRERSIPALSVGGRRRISRSRNESSFSVFLLSTSTRIDRGDRGRAPITMGGTTGRGHSAKNVPSRTCPATQFRSRPRPAVTAPGPAEWLPRELARLEFEQPSPETIIAVNLELADVPAIEYVKHGGLPDLRQRNRTILSLPDPCVAFGRPLHRCSTSSRSFTRFHFTSQSRGWTQHLDRVSTSWNLT